MSRIARCISRLIGRGGGLGEIFNQLQGSGMSRTQRVSGGTLNRLWARSEGNDAKRFVASYCWLLGIALGSSSIALHAEIPSWHEEYGNRLKYAELVEPLKGDIFGESVNLYDGAVSFSATELSLPGNSGLPVSIGRKLDPTNPKRNLAFGDWELDIPSLSGVFGNDSVTVAAGYWAPAQRCASVGVPPVVRIKNVRGTYDVDFADYEYWDGNRLSLPGGGGGELLGASGDVRQVRPNIAEPTRWNTKDGWFFSCLSALKSGQPGQGFVGHAPDGNKYYFDWMVVRDHNDPAHKQSLGPDTHAVLRRNKVLLYPSQIVDRFGNWVRYDWSGAQLQRIYSNDGRSIGLAYDSAGRIASVTSGTRQWTYQYDGTTSRLLSVTLPDGTAWGYNIIPPALVYKQPQTQNEPESNYRVRMDLCAKMGIFIDNEAVYTVNHPSGAVGTFRLRPIRHGRMGVRFDCQENGENGTLEEGWNQTPLYRDAYTLKSKTISGPALPTAQWQYEYLNLGGRYDRDVTLANWPLYPTGNAEHKFTVETGPDGTVKRYEFGKEVRYNDGRLLGVATMRNGATVKVETTSYIPESQLAGASFPASAGNSYVYGSDEIMSHGNRPVQNTSTIQDGVQFTRQVTGFDALARETSAVESNSAGQSRTTAKSYYDNTALWLMGQDQQEAVAGVERSRTEFDTATGLPVRFYAFGRLVQSVGYAADGTVASVSDGRGNATLLSSWKFGVPQLIRFPGTAEAPNGALRSAAIDDNGWIAALTDENGFTTNYSYDGTGRLASIQYPRDDSTAWNGVTFALQRIGTANLGLPAGHWLHSRTQGGHTTQTYLDALFRPVLTAELAQGQTDSAIVTRYDVSGQKSFISYPSRTVSDVNQSLPGTSYSYDALGRAVSLSQTSELWPLVTNTAYLGDLSVRVTNARGLATTTRYLAYSGPDYDTPLSIAQPEGVLTEIQRDVFGSPLAITRRNADGSQQVTRRYVYDAYQRLCKTIEPESGATVQDYDAAGNLAWSASGTALSSPSQCDTAAAQSSGRAAVRSYDPRNRLTQLRFPDGRGNQDWSYTADGLPASVSTFNTSAALPVVNTYLYNRRRLLVQESQQHVELGVKTMAYAYDANGALASHTYPGGRVVDYAPDPLGRPTRAGSFASDVTYYANGSMSRFVYGNGVVHTLVQNIRGLPDRSTDLSGGTAVLDDGYDYDAAGNVVAISDGVPGGNSSRDMAYDGLDRLKTVTSAAFGGASYSYDVLDNLRTAKVGTRDRTHFYDGSNRLTNVVDAVSGATLIGLGYDVQGNLNNRNGVAYDFDYGNRLRQVGAVEAYEYDAQGRRIRAQAAAGGAIYSFYDTAGVLRQQRNERTGKDVDYIQLNGSLVARVSGSLTPNVPALSGPGYVNQGTYALSWNAVGAATRYELQEAAGGGSWTGIYNAGALTFTVSGRSTGSFQYRVRACRDTCGGWSNTATVAIELPPSTVPAVSVPPFGDNGNYSVGWSTSAGATRYELEESVAGGGWSQSYSGAGLSKTFGTRTAGVYTYRVRGCNPIGCTGYSASGSVSVVYPPAATPAVSAPARATTAGFTVNWSAVGGADRYVFQESANGGAWSTLQEGAQQTFGTGARGVGMYAYRVAACNRAGCGGWSGNVSVQVIAPPTLEPSLSAPALVSGNAYTVSWSTPAGSESFQLEESVNGGGWTLVYVGGGASFATSKGKGSYGYRARACNFAGCGPTSGIVTVTVSPPPATPTMQLANWLTTRTAPYQVWCEVGWSAVADAVEYQLQTNAGKALYAGAKTYVSANGNAYCAYEYKVRACNAGGCSPWSNPPFPVTQSKMD
ncbi:wall-associated protein [Xanthomonas axonopodis]|uniref:wall-associated protein n=1 Tax=Xanthomonas axonopodis TaxID=53413 RepID=UPI003557A86B